MSDLSKRGIHPRGKEHIYEGLTVREHFAAEAYQALIIAYGMNQPKAESIASAAVKLADALVAELSKRTTHPIEPEEEAD